MENNASGTLYVVATPIGNLNDITPRALETLRNVQGVAAEDTRHTRALLTHFGIEQNLVALHQHNEEASAAQVVAKLLAGESWALVSDAGTPLMSDPGYRVVKAAQDNNIKVSPIPGACAAIAALSVAGLATDRFSFEGFLPAKNKARRDRLSQLVSETGTLVFYESAHRIEESLEDMVNVFGASRRASIARELTKLFETVKTAALAELLEFVQADPNQRKGEFVVMIEGAGDDADAVLREGERVYAVLKEHLPPSTAAKVAAELTGAPRKSLYGQ